MDSLILCTFKIQIVTFFPTFRFSQNLKFFLLKLISVEELHQVIILLTHMNEQPRGLMRVKGGLIKVAQFNVFVFLTAFSYFQSLFVYLI